VLAFDIRQSAVDKYLTLFARLNKAAFVGSATAKGGSLEWKLDTGNWKRARQ